jgi:hypothetical protein
MGKEGLRLVLLALKKEGIEDDDAPKAAEYYLENYRFIYRNPEDDTVCFRFPRSVISHFTKSRSLLLYLRGIRAHF